MKRRFLSVCAAMFLYLILFPATVRAADTAYAILYADGELVFQNDDAPESERTVKQTYTVDLASDDVYAPWYFSRQHISSIDFADVICPSSMRNWFSQCENLERVDNIRNLDTSAVTKMSNLFSGCSSLKTLDVSGWNTSRATTMYGMFRGCSSLKALDVSGWDTANVTSMYETFYGCSGLTALNVSRFDTANVTNMSGMFQGCSGLTVLDLSAFDTAKVTSMSVMFSGCSSLETLNLSGWNTANVASMEGMFSGCFSLATLDLSGFDTVRTTDTHFMFRNCSSLKTIYASDKFLTDTVTNKLYMFLNCASLVGGAGTKYAYSETDAEYARIDTPSAPGYFTSKDAPAPTPVVYTVTWKNDDGAVLKTDTVARGATPVYSGATPAKSGYAFAGWTPTPAPVSGNVTYTATFDALTYTVTWKNDDGAVLKTDTVAYGAAPVYSGATPTKSGHVFAGWTPTPAPVSGNVTYTATFAPAVKTFDVKRDAYAFGNSLADFDYTSRGPGAGSYPIPAKSFFLVFGESVAGKMMYSRIAKNSVWSGNCAGMSGSVALFYADGNAKPSDFGKDNVWSLTIGDAHDGLSARTFIEAMQIAQYTEAFAKARAEHSFEYGQSLMPLALAVQDAAAQGRPTLIAIVKNEVGGHALLAVGAEDVGDAGAKLQIYDCNHPGELQYLTIENTSEWRYDMGGYGVWGDSSCSIAYVPYETLESIWEHRGNPQAMCETLTVNAENVSVTNYADEEVAKLVNGKLVTDRADVYEMPELSMYWPKERTIFLPRDYYNVSTEDDITLEATMTDQRMSASISTSANTVSFAVDDATKSNTVTVENASASDTYSVSLESDFEDVRYHNVTLSGTGQGQTVEISMNQNGKLALSNCNIESLSLDGAAQITYVITAIAGEGGSVTPEGDTRIPAETDRTFVFAPAPGYKVQTVRLDGVDIGPRDEYTFRNVIEKHILVVQFEKVPDAYAVSATSDGRRLNVALTNPGAVTVAVSYFDKAGKFLSADLQAVSANAGSVTFPLADAHAARVTLLDAQCKPLCEPAPIAFD